jgi:ESS family glutamate:Na+ symporter
MVVIVYLITFAVTAGITSGIAALSEGLAGTVNTLLWGFNFIIGSALAILLRVILDKFKDKGTIRRPYQDNYLLNRLSGAFFDIMIVAGIGTINIEDIRGLVLPFILLVIFGTITTWFHLRWVCKAVYGDYYYEGLISMYGMLTGTISSGILLVREIDPQLETPAANNLIVGSSFGILLGAPVLVLVGLAAKSNAMCFVTLLLALVYLAILDLIIFKVGRHAKAKKA